MKKNKLIRIFIYRSMLLSAGTLFSLFNAKAVSYLIDKAINLEIQRMISFALLFVIVSIIYHITRGISSYYVDKKTVLIKKELKFELYHEFFAQSSESLYNHQNTGDLLESFRDDFDTITRIWNEITPTMVISIVSYIIYTVYAGYVNWKLCIIMLVLSQLQLIVPLIINPKFYDNYAEDREWEAMTTNVEIEAHSAFRDIRIFNLKSWYSKYLTKFQDGAAAVGTQYEYLCGMGTLFETLVSSVLKYGTYVIIGVFVFMDLITIDNAALLIYLSVSLYSSLMDAYNSIIDFSENRMANERIAKITNDSIGETKNNLRYGSMIDARNVKVIADEKIILSVPKIEISSDIPNVITGSNGSGKSTLLKVLAGFIVPDDGEFNVSGKSDGVFYLPQNDMKLCESALEIAENVNIDEYRSICTEQFRLSNEILTQPINTLSSGECKQIYLALTFAQNENKYILLDEPTNHLDEYAKKILCEMIVNRKNKIVLISHDKVFLDMLKSRTMVSVTNVEREDSVSNEE